MNGEVGYCCRTICTYHYWVLAVDTFINRLGLKCKTNNTHHYVYKVGLPSTINIILVHEISFEIYFITTPHGPYLYMYVKYNNRMGNEIYYACKNNNYWVIML